jgi:glycosyltransferase involved in cell wall biosynthesis
MTRFPIVMKVWAGSEAHDFEYVRRSIPSLLRSALPRGAEVLLFDDCSTDPRLAAFLRDVASRDSRVRVFTNATNKGPNRGQADAFVTVAAEYADAPFFMNVDDDVVYHRQWLTRLLEAKDELECLGLTGILTALNMPFRAPCAEVRTANHRYLLKWKQPALNWLIPRDVYCRVGPFADDGIAYDTVYSHWLRLHGLPIICVTPSYVQNIGTFGAYSKDGTTTAHDFVGEDDGVSPLTRTMHTGLSAVSALQRRISESIHGIRTIAPIRWGSYLMYEAVGRDGETIVVSRMEDAMRAGWEREELVRRADEIKKAQPTSPLCLRAVKRSMRGVPILTEYHWTFLPTLREVKHLASRYRDMDARQILSAVVRDLSQFHRSGVVHNKIRQDNIYVGPHGRDLHLAWFGTEPPQQRTADNAWLIGAFGGAVHRQASAEVRERYAVRYLESVAPEVLAGDRPTPRSDVFAVGAAILRHLGEEIETWADLNRVKAEWATGHSARSIDGSSEIHALLMRCVSRDPSQRPESALHIQDALIQSSSAA